MWSVGWECKGNLVQEWCRSQVWRQNKYHSYWQVRTCSHVWQMLHNGKLNMLTFEGSTNWPLMMSNQKMRETTLLCQTDMRLTFQLNSVSWVLKIYIFILYKQNFGEFLTFFNIFPEVKIDYVPRQGTTSLQTFKVKILGERRKVWSVY